MALTKFITKFATQSDYDAAKYDLDYPNVSLVATDPDTPIYVKTKPEKPHEFVEIGGIKWATMNLGATGVTDYGLFYQWGDTQGYTPEQCGRGENQKYFSWSDYKYSYNGSSTMVKYTQTDQINTLLPEDDAVTAAWGSDWRMATKDEYEALSGATTTAWTYDYQGSGVDGLVLTDKTDSSKVLFFPVNGSCAYGSWSGSERPSLNYWTSSCYPYEYDANHAVFLGGSGSIHWNDHQERLYGLSIRGIFVG